MPPTFPDPRTLPPCLLPHLRTFAVGGCTFDTLPLGRGEYERGDKEGLSDEQPIRTVRIDYDVELGRYPITQALWQAVMGENPADFPGDERPVERVSWDDIRQPDGFLDRLNAQCRTADGQPLPGRFRLPSEAEWEYAARGSHLGDLFPYRHPGSTHPPEVVWYKENSQNETQTPGRKMPNAAALHDLGGNVWEWVEDDWRSAYDQAPDDGSPWIHQPERAPRRVRRGGSWIIDAGYARVAYRRHYHPGIRNFSLGFRVAFVPQSVG